MKILVNLKRLSLAGGIETLMFQTTRELARRGHAIDIVYVEEGDLASEYQHFCHSLTRIPQFDVSPHGEQRNILRAARLGLDLRNMLRGAVGVARIKPDVIYAQGMFSLPFAWLAAHIARRPVVCHMHGVSPRAGTHFLGRGIRHFIAVSDYVRSTGIKEGLESRWITTVHPGVDLSRFSMATQFERHRAREVLGLPENAFIALYAARLEPGKGIDLLLDAWRLLALGPDEAILLVLGTPIMEADPQAYLRQLHEVAPVGCRWLPMQADMVTPFHAADVTVVPSRWQEPFGLVTIEAMATGIPVIGSRVGGIPEVLSGPFERLLFEREDREGLAARLGELVGWQQREPDLGIACRNHVQEHFELFRMVDEVEAVLRSVAGTSSSASS